LTVAFAVCGAKAQDCTVAERNVADSLTEVGAAIDAINRAVERADLALFLANDGRAGAGIPVVVATPVDAQGTVARVPIGCRVIVIGGAELDRAISPLVDAGDLSTDDRRPLLILLLLHELGHIAAGDYGMFIDSADTAQQSLPNLNPTQSKEKEETADDFAAATIRAEFDAMSTGDAVLPVAMVSVLLSKLAFVTSARASINCFGCRPLGSPDIFWDHGLSHPNTEYRLLRMNNAVAPDIFSKQLLADFEHARNLNAGRGDTD
jgi:hypothetical protein